MLALFCDPSVDFPEGKLSMGDSCCASDFGSREKAGPGISPSEPSSVPGDVLSCDGGAGTGRAETISVNFEIHGGFTYILEAVEEELMVAHQAQEEVEELC